MIIEGVFRLRCAENRSTWCWGWKTIIYTVLQNLWNKNSQFLNSIISCFFIYMQKSGIKSVLNLDKGPNVNHPKLITAHKTIQLNFNIPWRKAHNEHKLQIKWPSNFGIYLLMLRRTTMTRVLYTLFPNPFVRALL